MSYKNITIKNQDGNTYHPETNVDNILGIDKKADLEYVDKKIKDAGKVKSVNNKIGDVILDTDDIYLPGGDEFSVSEAFYTLEEVLELIVLNKADQEYVDTELEQKANKDSIVTSVNGQKGDVVIYAGELEYEPGTSMDEAFEVITEWALEEMKYKADKNNVVTSVNGEKGDISLTSEDILIQEGDQNTVYEQLLILSKMSTSNKKNKADLTYVDRELKYKAEKSDVVTSINGQKGDVIIDDIGNQEIHTNNELSEDMNPIDFNEGITIGNVSKKSQFPSVDEWGVIITFISEDSGYGQVFITVDGDIWSRRSNSRTSWRNWYSVRKELNKKANKSELDNVKQSGVETNRILVDALNSKNISASTNDNVKTNAKKVSEIRTERNWYLKNINPDPLFEREDEWRAIGPVSLEFDKHVAQLSLKYPSSITAKLTRDVDFNKYDIKLIEGKKYRISFYVKHTNKNNPTTASLFTANGGYQTTCKTLNNYTEGDNYTKYTDTFIAPKTGYYNIEISTVFEKKVGDKMYIKELIIHEGTNDELFVPKFGDYSIGNVIYPQDLKITFDDKNPFSVWEFTGHINSVNSVTVDNQGYVYSSSYDKKVFKISPSGNKIWEFTEHTDRVFSVAVDDNGYIYSGGRDNKVMKISPNGNKIWEFTGHTDRVWSVAVDKQSYVYSGGDDKKVMKISPSGNKIWEFIGDSDAIMSVAVDKNYYVYSGGWNDKKVMKISPQGNKIWEFAGPTRSIRSVAVDSQGYVYSGSSDSKVFKISPSGSKIWEFTEHTDIIRSVAVDSEGYVYSGSDDKKVFKISPSGSKICEFTEHTDSVFSVTVDKQNYIYSGGRDNKVMKISPGQLLHYTIIS